MTKQRKDLYSSLEGFSSFFNAEELFEKASKKNEKIGIATVYRFLKKLVEDHELHSYTCEGKTIYSKNKHNHCHFICKKCGKKEHIDVKKLDFLEKGKKKVCHFQIDITGTCEDCVKR